MERVLPYVTEIHFVMTIAYVLILLLAKKLRMPYEERIWLEFVFFISGGLVWFFAGPYDFAEFMPYLLFNVTIVLTSDFLGFWNKPKVATVGLLVSTFISSLIISLILKPTYRQDILLYSWLTSNVAFSFFYYIITLLSLMSFLLGFCWMSYSDFVASKIWGRNKPSLPIAKLVFTHIQLVPLVLLPLFIAEIFGRIDLLNSIALILSSICLTQVFLLPYCLSVAFMGEKILKAKFLWITSIFSLISFANAIYLAFQFVALNMDYGPLALAIIVSSVFNSALGIILSRIS